MNFRKPGVAAALATATLLLSGCAGQPDAGPSSHVRVDTPDLHTLKQQAHVEPCRPGPGGGHLPEVTLACLGGGTPVDLASLRGPLVLSLWQSACGPCREEMPVLQAFHERYGSRVPVLGIDFLDTFPGTALQQVKQRGVTYPLLADPGGDLQSSPEFARVRGLPMLFLVDAKGDIAFAKAGAVTSTDELATLVRDHLGVDG